jgi:hypothetical protein
METLTAPRKVFNRKDFNDNDPLARQAVRRIFQKDWVVEENPFGEFDIDMRICNLRQKETIYYVEVERRPEWRGNLFPFRTVHIPERKTKFFTKYLNGLYVAVNQDYTYALLTTFNVILNSGNPIPCKNKHVKQGELFYPVERESFKLCKIPKEN